MRRARPSEGRQHIKSSARKAQFGKLVLEFLSKNMRCTRKPPDRSHRGRVDVGPFTLPLLKYLVDVVGTR